MGSRGVGVGAWEGRVVCVNSAKGPSTRVSTILIGHKGGSIAQRSIDGS